MLLSNKLALITGSASGIGKSIAKVFAQNGASLALADLETSQLTGLESELRKDVDANSGQISIHKCDVSSRDQVKNMFEEIKSKHQSKSATIIVNSAGITRDSYFLKMTEADFDKVINVNLKGTFLVTQEACRILVGSSPGKSQVPASIINISSVVGKYGNVGQTNYAASKAGVMGFTVTTAKELGRFGIRCNAILPGFIRTPMTETVPKNVLNMIVNMIPLARMGEPDEVAQLALFLASERSSYITGSSIECSAGLAF